MKNLPFKIGADPEYIILLQNKLVPANQLLKNLFTNSPKGDMGYKVDSAGVLGWDGASATGEIRPSPCNSPLKLVKNIEKLFKHFVNKTELFALSTLSNKAPIGGHIHFELPQNKQGKVSVGTIHKKMMAFYVPVMLGENNMNLRIRNRQNYGRLTDHRSGEHGGTTTYEFRVPSAEWLTTPKIAEATLAYLSCVYNEIINKPNNLLRYRDFMTKNDAQAKALQELTISNFEALTALICNKVKKAIKTFEYYEHYKEQIDFILTPRKILREKEKVDYNIVVGWKLAHNSNPTKRQLLSEKQLQERATKVDMDSLACLITVQFNPDECVDMFVRAIKHRIVAMNWKLKNNYFLFGLKKGIKEPIVKDKAGRYIFGAEQIKTQMDLYSMNGTFSRMNSRFRTNNATANNDNKKEIVIGLPYDLRIKQNTRNIIELIHSIEKKIYTPVEIKSGDLYNDSRGDGELECAPSKLGKIWKIYKHNEETENISTIGEDALATAETRREIEAEEAAVEDEANNEEEEDGENSFKKIPKIYSLLNKEAKLYNDYCCMGNSVPTKKGLKNWICSRKNKNLCAE